ncbi:hypothetical protein M413DRAFT_10152 [Hebeloma cylindrosporum]|uniref:Polynucleotide 5'-hydroxyl-kinase GRC3 n=1 Tax=Hebeloma cylindrosporum TaxID=76867 RepID=A0A0C3C196_HEBCY|nr:hypothetical protein M413DRAFT_10152 [Hebeloma cylindrosporum h7]
MFFSRAVVYVSLLSLFTAVCASPVTPSSPENPGTGAVKKLKQFDIRNAATKTYPDRRGVPSAIPKWQPDGGSDDGDDGGDDNNDDGGLLVSPPGLKSYATYGGGVVAARKAALAAQSSQTPEPPFVPSGSGSGTSSPKPPSPTKNGGSKRKPSSQKAQTTTKKPRKLKPFEKSNPLPVVDVFQEQVDMIVVDSEGEESEESAMSVLDDSEQEPISQPSKKSQEKRAWSPSRPVDSSEDDSEDGDVVGSTPLDLSSLFPHLHRGQEEQSDDGRVLSTFKPTVDENLFYLNEEELSLLGLSGTGCLVALNTEETLCLLGTCTLAVLHGSVALFGTTLSASLVSYPMYAPRSSPLPIIKPSNKTISVLPTGNLPPRLRDLPLFKAVIFIQELKTNVEGLGNICRTFYGVFQPSAWQRSSSTNPFKISGLSLVMEQGKEVHPFTIPPSWEVALEGIARPDETGSYIVKGPKNSGKSTFARTLVNRLLESYQRVAFLECDIGQSEFTPGGMVSLNVVSSPIFGPPFTHPTLPNYAHYVGSVTPRSSPSHYLDAVQALIQTYRLDVQNPALETSDNQDPRNADVIPIVVNTMGWTKGLGADLTQRIEIMLEPTDVFDIQAPVRDEFPISIPPIPNGNMYSAYQPQSTDVMMDRSASRIHVLESISSYSSAAGYNAADHRALSILSYFHARFPMDVVPGGFDQVTARSWDVSRPLCAVPPYQIDCTIAFDKIMLTGSGSEDVVEDEIARVLNGAVVAFVSCEPGTVERGTPTSAGIPYTRQQGPPSPESSNCVGIGLIRGISPPKTDDQGQVRTFLHMLTPLPHRLLASARVLVKGEMELPVWGMLDFRNFNDGNGVHSGDVAGVPWDKVPFLQWGKAPEGVMGAEKRRVRRNLMRRGQMM